MVADSSDCHCCGVSTTQLNPEALLGCAWSTAATVTEVCHYPTFLTSAKAAPGSWASGLSHQPPLL